MFLAHQKFVGVRAIMTDKRILIMRRLIWAVMLMTLLDAVCTAIGIRLGLITEWNPLLRGAVQRAPVWAGAASCAYTGAFMTLVYRFGPRARCTIPLLAGLCTVKLAVMGMHLGWLFML
jgi:hypothetical protein